MWLKVKTTKMLPKMFLWSSPALHHPTCVLNQLSGFISYLGIANLPGPQPCFCIFRGYVVFASKHKGSAERFPSENFLIILSAVASEAIPQASPASSPSSLYTENRIHQKSLSCLAFPSGQVFFRK